MPNLKDWAQAGKVLALLAAKYDFEKIARGRLTNDALIAVSAARTGMTVITANARDFARLAEFSTLSVEDRDHHEWLSAVILMPSSMTQKTLPN